MDPTYPLAPIANLLGCFLVLVSLSPKMFQAWNIGIYMFAIWIAILCLAIGINTIVWSDNVNDVAPVLCDITGHLNVGTDIAIPSCTFVITCRLSKIIRHRESTPHSGGKRVKDIIFDISLCLGLPIIYMALFYIVQDKRYDIVEEIGCQSDFASAWVALIPIDVIPMLLPAISACFYCPRIIWTFYLQRKEVNKFLDSNDSVNRTSYYRMLALGCLDIIVTLPVQLVGITIDVAQGHAAFWPGWSAIHSNWTPLVFPKSEWSKDRWSTWSVEWSKWINPFYAVIIFVLFGLTEDAPSRYFRAFCIIAKPLGFEPLVKPETSDVIFESMGFNSSDSENIHNSSVNLADTTAEVHDALKTFEALPSSEEGRASNGTERKDHESSIVNDGEVKEKPGIAEIHGNGSD